ncbi:hypothetical protein F994_02779 [Acinetobacter bohemicus ANC 3994]|uniref:Uncharacterized protein n=1 Tax=Acinetobacter bohemicus ANC 3994 TaxID=1217715 RepID=N8Q9R6_9GAMM|nr:hypothetical protein [Acinetobacter bohemicus]ENU18652.1 hypothetical protein F994_02779 [Acinetobacter bohemicus ANC 3994]
MANIKKKDGRYGQFGGFSPYGNLTALTYLLATNATGAVLESDSTAAVGIGDVIDLGELPEGMRLDDAQVFVTTGMTATVTGSLGFKYTDGVNDAATPQDAAHFISAGDLAAVGRLRATGAKLITLPKPARLILTVAGAANAKVSDIKVVVYGELKGPR